MVSKVYFCPANISMSDDEINSIVQKLLNSFCDENKIKLENKIYLKVSFGEAGNKTFIPSKWMIGAIDFLKKRKIKSAFVETNVLYKGRRTTRKEHTILAKEHGFTQLPIIIADGEMGENFVEIQINKEHFKSCKIAKKIADEKQLLIVSHFKGHRLAGFGGSIKQLAMGCASRGGKLAQHSGSVPIINPITCKKCSLCIEKCPVKAISMGKFSAKIDKKKCIGCASCIAVCPYSAIKVNWLDSLGGSFTEKLVEYAYAVHLTKKNIYLSYAINMTKGCDCEGHKMNPIVSDLGIFVSDDPVACDKAIFDMLKEKNNKNVFSEKNNFKHAKKINFGSLKYKLIEIKTKV